MITIKKCIGITKIDEKDFEEFGNNIQIYLKYYKTKLLNKSKNKRFGIEIIKEEKEGRNFKKEKAKIYRLSDNEEIINKLLLILMQNKVTPIESNDVIRDIKKKYFMTRNLI